MSKQSINVVLPVNFMHTGLYWRTIGPKGSQQVLYTPSSRVESIQLETPTSVFVDSKTDEDPSLLGLSGTSFQAGAHNKLVHLNPVYHHKMELSGTVRVNFPDSVTVTAGNVGTYAADSGVMPGEDSEWRYLNKVIPGPASVYTDVYTDLGRVAPVTSLLACGVSIYRPKGEHWHAYSWYVGWRVMYHFVEGQFTGIPIWTTLEDPITRSCWDSLQFAINQHSAELDDGDPEGHLMALIDKFRTLIAGESPRTTYIGGNFYSDLQVGPNLPSIPEIRTRIQSAIPKFTADTYMSFRGAFALGDLAYKAYENVGYADNNGIAYLKDALELRQSVLGSIANIRNVFMSKGKRRAKEIARSYLSGHYGYKLTLADTASYIKELRKNRQLDLIRRCASQATVTADNWTVTGRYQLYFTNKQVGHNEQTDLVNKFLERVDFMPTLENIWDMVPYSFVVDWFTSVGDNLSAIGNLGVLQAYFKVLGYTYSTRAVKELQLSPSIGDLVYWDGVAREIIYERTSGSNAIIPSPQPSSLVPSSLLQHSVEGAALVVTKL